MNGRLRLAGCVVLFAGLCAADAAFARPARVRVNCDRGEHIRAALRNPAAELVIEIRGMCEEDVLVTRDKVTLRGADPERDGIRSTSTGPHAALTLRRSHEVVVENLRLTGTGGGLLSDGSGAEVSHCRIQGNTFQGVFAEHGSNLGLTDTTISDNSDAALWVFSSSVVCDRCTVRGRGFELEVLIERGDVSLSDSSVSAAGILVEHSSLFFATRSSIGGAQRALVVGADTDAFLDQVTLEGSFSVGGGHLRLWSVAQTANLVGNLVADGGFAEVATTRERPPTTLVGTMAVELFGKASAMRSVALGALVCASGGDLWCDASVTKDSSSCGSCP